MTGRRRRNATLRAHLVWPNTLRRHHTMRVVPPEPPGIPLLTVYQGRLARGIATGNQLVTQHQVARGDT